MGTGPLTRHAAALTMLALVLLPGSAPLAGAREVRDRLGLTASAASAVTVTPVPDARKEGEKVSIPGAGVAGALAAIALMGSIAFHPDRRVRPPATRSACVNPRTKN